MPDSKQRGQTAADNRRGNSARHGAKRMADGQPQTLSKQPNITSQSAVRLMCQGSWICDISVRASAQRYSRHPSKFSYTEALTAWGWVVRVTPTNPAHRERIRGRIKTTAPAGMCHIQMGALLSPRQSFGAMSHSRNPRWGRGLREGAIFFTPRHKATERRSP